MSDAVFRTKGLKKYFPAVKRGILDTILRAKIPMIKAVDGVDVTINTGEVVALVGESGSGKSTFGRMLVCLESPTDGEIQFMGQPVTGKENVRRLRRNVQMVFQNPADSLDPRKPIRSIVTEPLIPRHMKRREKDEKFSSTLSLVGLDADTFAYRRPRDLSGGQKQRVALARAMISDPKFIVLDEPTSALDASVQGQVLNLLAELHEKLGFTYLLITHNIAVARYISDRIAVMYAGKIVETGPTRIILRDPKHPYSQALLKAVPTLGKREITPPVGEVPSLVDLPEGCRYHPRCPFAQERCMKSEPPFFASGEVEVACWLYE
jgi:peptide/nickel transport system ATP-binding protein